MSKVMILSSDCHAGALPAQYEEYLPRRFHDEARAWWVTYAREMMARAGTFFDQEAVDNYEEESGEGRGIFSTHSLDPGELSDEQLLAMLSDEESPFSPRRGEFDMNARTRELDQDGVAGEVIFPQMAPFGAGLIQYRQPISPEQNLEGNRAYNRWLADFCKTDPERHKGVAVINVDDIAVSVQEIRAAHAAGLDGGVLLPTSTGDHPFYHHGRYEPLWDVCEELDLPLQLHSGWSPDYGDVPSATPMFITEVDGYAHRPFPALVWSGAFERHPKLRLIFTEAGTTWALETLRLLEYKADNPIFKYFTDGLSLSPTGYFQRHCFFGASFLWREEAKRRHELGLEKLMYGTDYPHLEGTFPNTLDKLRETFEGYPEEELRAILGGNAASLYGFDAEALAPVVERVGPSVEDILGA